VRILGVREILQYSKVTRVPQTPPWIRGVINVRGSVVPVVDLGAKFGLGESEVLWTTCVVLLEVELGGEATVMGIMTDKVNKVVELGESQIEPPPAFGTRVRPDCLLGIAPIGEQLACILDVDRVLSLDEMLAAKAAADDTPENGFAEPTSDQGPLPEVDAPAEPTSRSQPRHRSSHGGSRRRTKKG
jgi:purine-binding chemotaxis protein CheW